MNRPRGDLNRDRTHNQPNAGAAGLPVTTIVLGGGDTEKMAWVDKQRAMAANLFFHFSCQSGPFIAQNSNHFITAYYANECTTHGRGNRLYNFCRTKASRSFRTLG